jgi:hypothetical protein
MVLRALPQSWCAWPLIRARPILASILRFYQLSGMANKTMEMENDELQHNRQKRV